MKIGRGSRRSIRYYVFIGILVGSIFSGSGAFAAEVALLELRAAVLNGDVQLEAGDTYIAGDPTDPLFLGGGSSYFGDFSGSFSGNGATITGLTVPLFNIMSGSVSQLNLITEETGLTGQGVLANVVDVEVVDGASVFKARPYDHGDDQGGVDPVRNLQQLDHQFGGEHGQEEH